VEAAEKVKTLKEKFQSDITKLSKKLADEKELSKNHGEENGKLKKELKEKEQMIKELIEKIRTYMSETEKHREVTNVRICEEVKKMSYKPVKKSETRVSKKNKCH